MIGFSVLEVYNFNFKITEQNETLRIARKNYSNVPGTINKTNLISVTRKRDFKWKVGNFWVLRIYQSTHPDFAKRNNKTEGLTKSKNHDIKDKFVRCISQLKKQCILNAKRNCSD